MRDANFKRYSLRQWFTWWFYRRWHPAVIWAYEEAWRDKGYISLGDHWDMRDGTHWALRAWVRRKS